MPKLGRLISLIVLVGLAKQAVEVSVMRAKVETMFFIIFLGNKVKSCGC